MYRHTHTHCVQFRKEEIEIEINHEINKRNQSKFEEKNAFRY